MLLYHASNIIVRKPGIVHSRNALDFGRGFYLTRLREQAEKYSLRFSWSSNDPTIRSASQARRYSTSTFISWNP